LKRSDPLIYLILRCRRRKKRKKWVDLLNAAPRRKEKGIRKRRTGEKGGKAP